VEATQKKFTGGLALRYGPLYRQLGLTADQVAAFEQALAERNQSTLDIWAAAAKQGLSSSDPSILKMTSGPIRALEAKLREILGTGFEAYQEYEKTQTARAVVSNLAGNLYYTDSPLTAAQGDLLARAIAVHTEQKKRPLVMDREGQVIYSLYTETDWDKVAEASRSVLSAQQLQTLRQLGEQQKLDARISDLNTQSKGGR
jgi:hypothetical protein